MKSFQSLSQFYQISGIFPLQPNQNCLLNSKNSYFLISMLTLLITTASFSFFKTASIADYGKSFYGVISVLIYSINFLITIYKSTDIFKLIDKFDKFMEKSKLFFSLFSNRNYFIIKIYLLLFRKKKQDNWIPHRRMSITMN